MADFLPVHISHNVGGRIRCWQSQVKTIWSEINSQVNTVAPCTVWKLQQSQSGNAILRFLVWAEFHPSFFIMWKSPPLMTLKALIINKHFVNKAFRMKLFVFLIILTVRLHGTKKILHSPDDTLYWSRSSLWGAVWVVAQRLMKWNQRCSCLLVICLISLVVLFRVSSAAFVVEKKRLSAR